MADNKFTPELDYVYLALQPNPNAFHPVKVEHFEISPSEAHFTSAFVKEFSPGSH